MNKWFEPIPFAVRICLSGIGACLSGWIVFSLSPPFLKGPTMRPIYEILLSAAFFVPLTLILIWPLLLIAVVLGLAFRKLIAQRPFIWTIGASVATWITTISVMTLNSSKNEWWLTHSNAERLTYVITSGDNMLVVAGALGAGAMFYLLGLIQLGQKQAA